MRAWSSPRLGASANRRRYLVGIPDANEIMRVSRQFSDVVACSPVLRGTLTARDIARYHLNFPAPTRSDYRGLDVYGMAAPSSGLRSYEPCRIDSASLNSPSSSGLLKSGMARKSR